MKDISTLHLAWRKYAIFWVSSMFLAPITFGWLLMMILSIFIDGSTTVGYATSISIIVVSYFTMGSLARAEVAAIRKEIEDNPAYAELTKVIMEAARKQADDAKHRATKSGELNSGSGSDVEDEDKDDEE